MNNGSGQLAAFLTGAVAVGVLGLWEGHPFVFLSLYGLAIAGWNIWQQMRFSRWLAKTDSDKLLTGHWSQMARVITHRQAGEQERRHQLSDWLKQFQDSSEAFPDGVVLIDEQGRIQWLNDAAVQILALDPARDNGKPVNHLIRHPEFGRYLQEADKTQQLIIESPVDNRLSVALQVATVPGGRRLLVAKDVTEVEVSEMARRDFVANASHELRSPLTVIRGYLDAMDADESLDDGWREPVKEMSRQAARMSELLRDLMDLSRLERLYRKAELTEIWVEALLYRVKEDLREVGGRERQITISANSDIKLLGERSEIFMMVSNLVANAIRYSAPGSRIDIGWDIDHNGAHLSVADQGIGIPEEDIPRLTERFYRVDKGRSREQGGTGLGLAIVHNALLRHDGHLEVISTVGRGTTMICHFPVERIISASGTDNVLIAS